MPTINVLNELQLKQNGVITSYKIGTVNGYYNPADGKFYEESTHVTEIEGAPHLVYADIAGNALYIYKTSISSFVKVSGEDGVSSLVYGYLNSADGKFYEDSSYTTEIFGDSDKLFITLDDDCIYRYDTSDTAFVAIGSNLTLGETSSTAYRGDRGKVAYDTSLANAEAIATFGTAATKDSTSTITSGSTDLIEAGAVYTALADKVDTSSIGVASGIAELDANGKVPSNQLGISLDNNSDVSLTNLGEGDILTYDGTNEEWVNTSNKLGNIYDVNLTNLQNGDRIKYDQQTDSWINGPGAKSDWANDNPTDDSYIVNKPNLGGAALVNITNTATQNSTDAFTSGGAYTALNNKADKSTSLSGYGITNAYTKDEVDNMFSELIEGMTWKPAVATYADIATTYPNPQEGWTVCCTDTNIVWRYSGGQWIQISANTIPIASTSENGLMSTSMVTKLNGIATGAEINQNAFSNIKVDSTTIEADGKTDTLELVGSNVTLTPDAANDKITIGITKGNVTSALGYTPPTSDTNTHRPIQVNGTEILGNNVTALNLKAGDKISLSNSSGTVTISSVALGGATSTADGTGGYINATPPKDGYNSKFFRADGTWSAVTKSNVGLGNVSNSAQLPLAGGTMTGRIVSAKPNTFLVTGSGTAASDKGSGVSPRYFPAKWTFNTGITAANGDVIFIKIPVAGHSYGVYVSIDNGTKYYPVVTNGTSRLTTHFPDASYIMLQLDTSASAASIYPLAGGDATTTVTGGAWRVVNYYDSNTDIRPSAYCETAAETAAKAASCTNYSLLNNSYVLVLMRYTNTSQTALTLNINGKGAKPIYINGSASSTSNYTLPAGTYLVYYDGTNYYFRTDGKITGNITGNAATATKLGTSTVGGTAKPIYLNSGTPTAISSTVGSTSQPVYLNGGTLTAISSLSTAYGGTGNTSGYITAGRLSGSTLGTRATTEGYNTVANGSYSHAEGEQTTTNLQGSHAEGYKTSARGYYSHAEGTTTTARGNYSHAEGGSTIAYSDWSHAEGAQTTASNTYAHAEGNGGVASGSASHAECWGTKATGSYSHAEGNATTASGECSHAGGMVTIAAGKYQTVIGRWNVSDTSNTYAFIIGRGSVSSKANGLTVDWSGNLKATSYANLSSRKYKENITDMTEEEAQKLLKLKPVNFDYIGEDNPKNQMGLIAEDVAEIMDYPIIREHGEVDSIDYSKFIPALIKLVQIQDAKIKTLEEKLNNL